MIIDCVGLTVAPDHHDNGPDSLPSHPAAWMSVGGTGADSPLTSSVAREVQNTDYMSF